LYVARGWYPPPPNALAGRFCCEDLPVGLPFMDPMRNACLC
jgi:hypothetical protein